MSSQGGGEGEGAIPYTFSLDPPLLLMFLEVIFMFHQIWWKVSWFEFCCNRLLILSNFVTQPI